MSFSAVTADTAVFDLRSGAARPATTLGMLLNSPVVAARRRIVFGTSPNGQRREGFSPVKIGVFKNR